MRQQDKLDQPQINKLVRCLRCFETSNPDLLRRLLPKPITVRRTLYGILYSIPLREHFHSPLWSQDYEQLFCWRARPSGHAFGKI